MLHTFKNGQTSIVLRVKLLDSSSITGAGLTGLTSASSGLIISTIADKEATATAYTVAGSTIEGITTLGTYAAPTATKCRFKEIDATNHKGVYELQFADARFAVSAAKSLLVSLAGATNLAQADFVVQLQTFDPHASITQTGDAYALIGTTGSGLTSLATQASVNTIDDLLDTEVAAIKTVVDSILVDTAVIGAAGAGLTALPWASGWYSDVAAAVWNAATASYGSAGSYGLYIETNLDVPVSTVGGGSLTEAGIADAVWDEVLSGHLTAGTTGAGLNAAGSAGDPWATAIPGAYGSGTAGKILGDNINATISSRATQTSVDAVDDLLDTEVAAIKTVVDSILVDTAVIGALGAGLTAIPWNSAWAAQIATSVWNAATATYGSAGSYGLLVETNLDAAVSGATAPSAATVADAVWDEVLSGHLTGGSTGAALNGAGAAGDPWGTAVPGAYSAGSAGYILGTNLDATVSSRATQTSVDAVDDLIDTEVAAIKTVVDSILVDTAVIGAAGAGLTALASAANLAVVAGYLDTEIAAIKAETASIQADTNDIQTRLPAALVGGRMDVSLSAIDASTTALAAFKRAVKGNVIGTVGVGSTTTSVVSSALTPAGSVSTQFKGRIITFADDTTTAALRGQSTDITASTASATPTFTVTALTTAAASGDTFSIT